MDIATLTDDQGFTTSSNYETEEELRAGLMPDAEPVAPAADPEPEPGVAKTEPPKVDKRTREGRKASIQQEFDELTAKKKEAAREYDAEQARLKSVRDEIAALEAQRTPPPTQVVESPKTVTQGEYARYMALPDAPKNDGSFTNYDDFLAAVSVFIADKRFEERFAQHMEAQRIDQSRASQSRTFADRIDAAEKVDPEWQARVNPDFLNDQGPYKPISYLKPGEPGTYKNGIAECILTSEHPVALMQYLTEHARDPDIQRLSTLPPDQFFRQMGKIEARLDAAPSVPAPARRPVSTAKPLIKTVSASAKEPSDDDGLPDDDASDAEIDRLWGAASRRVGR